MLSQPSPIPVLLLKTPSAPIDPYTTHFTTPLPTSPHTYHPHFVPVLSHTPHLSSLLSLFSQPFSATHYPYGALIFTSARSVSALSLALSLLPESTKAALARDLEIPLYAVGPATAGALRAVQEEWLPRCVVEGEEAGNGEVLAGMIIRDYNSLWKGKEGAKKAVLFVTGEKRRDVIPRMLMDEKLPHGEKIEVREVVAYSTGVEEGFDRDLGRVLGDTEKDSGMGGRRWVVVFSASGGEGLLRGLGWLEEGSGRVKEEMISTQGRTTFVASIGPTTKEYLERGFGFRVDVCAEYPSPEGVRKGIEEFMRERRAVGGEP